MLDSQKQYIVNLANLGNYKPELIGELAIFTKKELEKGIPIPVGFVITTSTFDDFLIANDLVDKIGITINSLNYNDIESVKSASLNIQDEILKGVFPDLIKQPIQKAYLGLSGFSEGVVNLKVSPINNDLKLSIKDGIEKIFGVSSIESLLISIKQIWADFFSTNALLYRAKIGYEGFLTEAVIIQKLVHAEISGRIFTINPIDKDENIMEIQAIWGIDDGNMFNNNIPDSYLIDKRSGDVVEKKIFSQDYMLVFNTKNKKDEPYIKVNISPVWQKRPKLDDRHLYLLFDYSSRVNEISERPQEIYWCIESGRVYFLDNKDLDLDINIEELYPLKKDNTESILQKIEEKPKQDIDYYVKEVNSEIETIKNDENKLVEEVSEVEETIVDDKLEDRKDEEKPEQEKNQEDEEEKKDENEERIVVDIEPLEDLTAILKGKGYKSKVKFGLAHFVFADYDTEDLTGDEILIIKTLKSSYIPIINSVRGAIIESELSDASLEGIRVPVLHGIKNAFEVLHDKEVITIDTIDGNVYVGAGVKNVDELKLDRRGLVDKEAEKADETLSSKLEAKLYDNPDNVPIKTTSDFWQYLDFDNLLIDNRNSQGFYFTSIQLMKALGFTPLDILKDSKLSKLFINEAAAFVRHVISISKQNNLIIQTASKLERIENNVEDKLLELLKIDIDLVLNLRNRDNFRSVWLALSDVQTESDLIEQKKEITANGIRRSSTFKLLGVVNNAYTGLGIRSLVENNNLDGIVIDLDELIVSLSSKLSPIDRNISNFVKFVIEVTTTNNALAILGSKMIEINNEYIKLFLNSGLSQFITNPKEMVDFKLKVSDMELSLILKAKKRGRKKKKIDFGF